ncbi:Spherulin-4 [Dactylellina cionopaga]|nr:Spherulin-4 [Dactylellina cionopaga]
MASLFQFLATPFSCCISSRKRQPAAPTNAFGTSILFPLYIYPDPGCWDRVFTVVSRHPEQHFTLVINPNSGPGTDKFPDAEYTDAIAKLNVYKNVTLIGYVHTTYGTRDLTQVIAEVERYAAWSTYSDVDIHVDGIFVDEAPGELGERKAHLSYLKTLHGAVKRAFEAVDSQGYLVTNPGRIVEKVFYNYADSIVSYEAAFKTMIFPDTLFTSTNRKLSPGTPSERQSVLIHTFDGSRRKQSELVQTLVNKGIGEVYVTTCDPSKGEGDYSRYSEYWEDFVAEMERTNLAARVTM